MGNLCCAAVTMDPEQKEELKRKRAKRDEIKLVLLGTGDSGKSTIFRQMRILYGEGYSEEAREAMKPALFTSLVGDAKVLVKATEEYHPLVNADAKEAAEIIREVEDTQILEEDTAHAITTLWRDKDFQEMWSKDRSKIQVLDSWADFAAQTEKYPKWGGKNWIPTVTDAIRARVRTSGIFVEKFVIDGANFVLYDVGGQRNERRKWVKVFNNITAVIFVAALSEYDQNLFEDSNTNRLVEALDLFDTTLNSKWFEDETFILFLNKIDIFQQKLKHKIPLNISKQFPDAPTNFDEMTAVNYIRSKFLSLNRTAGKMIHVHVTCAIDTSNVEVIFQACKNTILRRNLVLGGFAY